MSNIIYQRKKGNGLKYLVLILVAFVAGFFASQEELLVVGENPIESQNENEFEDVDLSLFWTVWNQLHTKYVDDGKVPDQEGLIYGAIRGMVESLDDPYTVFMTPEESEEFTASLDGRLEGIGAELTLEDDLIKVVSPLRDSPAERAGLLPGDIIYKVDGELTSDMSLFDAISVIRGEKGTEVVLSIVREGVNNPIEMRIIRDSIEIESVSVEELDGDIVYLSVNQFNEKTTEQFNEEISKLVLDKPKGLIIDLRYNGGGYLETAVEMLSFLLPADKEAVVLKERGQPDEVLYTNGSPKLLDVPLVVLVNEGSASASEIVAGAVQDHERGVIMGTQTFGKGTVQEVETFGDGSILRITIAKWFTPSGRSINDEGVTPDIIVEITDEDIENEVDGQRERAIEYLKGL